MLDLSPKQRGGLVRGTLVAAPGHKLVVCDFAGIEARVLAWLANDHDQIEVFRSGADPYKHIAATAIFFKPYDQITKDERGIGKIAELALGYGMGAKKFGEGNAKALAAQGLTAEEIVSKWRAKRAPVVKLWYELERQWDIGAGYFTDHEDGTRRMTLPSGRELVYRDADVHGRRTYFGRTITGRVGVCKVYGGLLTENLVQAASRCLLAAALVEAERAGLRPVLTVHDEIVCEVPEARADYALHTLELIMSEAGAPAWAAGCPIGCEGYVAERYRK